MSTTLIHAGRAFTPTTEIADAGILIREDVIEAIGPRAGMSLPAGALEIRAAEKTAVPRETRAGEDVIPRCGEKIIPLFDDEEQPRADQSTDGRRKNHCRSKLGIVAATLQLRAHYPGGGECRQRHEDAEAVNRYRTELE